MSKHQISILLAGLLLGAGCQIALADTTTTAQPTTTTTTTPTATTKLPPGLTLPPVTHKPVATPPKPTKPTDYDLTNGAKCPGGGTRAVSGKYDSVAGTANFVITLTGCVDSTNTTHDGTVTTTGTITAGTTTGTYNMDLTYVYDTHYVNSKADVQRQCTWEKVGTFDTATQKFAGTITKTNCTLTETETEPGDILEHVLKKATQTE